MSLSVEIVGLNEFIADVGKAGANSEPLMRAALQKSATDIQGNVRKLAPHRTGALQHSVLIAISFPSATVSVDEKYGQYVEYGTAPHIIAPVNKKALFWPGAANPYKVVHHPGTKANPFFSRGVEASVPYVEEQFSRVGDIVLNQLAGHL